MSYTIFKVKVNNFASLGGPSKHDEETSLSKPNSNRLKVAFPDGPQHTNDDGAPTTIVDVASDTGAWTSSGVTLTRAGYREFYKKSVLGGDNSNVVDNFGSPVSRDYHMNNPPHIGDTESPITVDDKSGASVLAGSTGATVVASGLGPNVSTKTGDVVDASPISSPPFEGDGSASPSTDSELISSGDLHHSPPGRSSASS